MASVCEKYQKCSGQSHENYCSTGLIVPYHSNPGIGVLRGIKQKQRFCRLRFSFIYRPACIYIEAIFVKGLNLRILFIRQVFFVGLFAS
jgi:hypothetical protein